MKELREEHLADLRSSGLADETIQASQCWSANARQVEAILGFGAGPGLVFPYPGASLPSGKPYQRVKPDRPFVDDDGSCAKYLSPKAQLNPKGNRLYIPPLVGREVLGDSATRLYITEGEKKALKACQEGFPTVALSGVWGWKTKANGGKKVIDDLSLIRLEGRCMAIVFDSDAAENPNIRQAEAGLRSWLAKRHADTFIVRLPMPTWEEAQDHGTKFGIDDFLIVRGSEEFQSLTDEFILSLPLACRPIAHLEETTDAESSWLVDGLWRVGDCGFVAGEPKTKKSFFTLDMAIAVATGQPFLGRPTRAGRVVLVDEENRRSELKRRVERLARGRGLSLSDLGNLHLVGQGHLRLDDSDAVRELERLISRLRPDLLELDPFVRLHRKKENESAEMSPMLSDLRLLQARYGVAIVIVHHFGKDRGGQSLAQRMRGSSDLHGWLDAAAYLQESDGEMIRLTFESRYDRAPAPMRVALVDGEDDVGWQVDGGTPDANEERVADLRHRILDALGDGFKSVTELAKELGAAGGRVSAEIDELEAGGRVTRMTVKGRPGRPKTNIHLLPLSDPSPPPLGEAPESESEDQEDERH